MYKMQYVIYATKKLNLKIPKFICFEIIYWADENFCYSYEVAKKYLHDENIIKKICGTKNFTLLKNLINNNNVCIVKALDQIARTESTEICEFFFVNYHYSSKVCDHCNNEKNSEINCKDLIDAHDFPTDEDPSSNFDEDNYKNCICGLALQASVKNKNLKNFNYFYENYQRGNDDESPDFTRDLIDSCGQNIELINKIKKLTSDDYYFFHIIEHGFFYKNEEIMLIGLKKLAKTDRCFDTMIRESLEYFFEKICKYGYIKALEYSVLLVDDLLPGFYKACEYGQTEVLDFLFKNGCNNSVLGFELGCEYLQKKNNSLFRGKRGI